MSPQNETVLPTPLKLAAAGLAGCTADLLTFPLDTMKVWLHVRGEATPVNAHLEGPKSLLQPRKPTPVARYPKRMASTMRGILKDPTPVSARKSATLSFGDAVLRDSYRGRIALVEAAPIGGTALQSIISNLQSRGPLALYGGLTAGLQRQIGFCSVRIGFYDNVKHFYFDLIPGAPESKMVTQRILAGATTGIMAVCLFQPTEVVKIRMQAEKTRYRGSLQAYREIIHSEGLRGAWKGTSTNCVRTSIVNVCELVTYDLVKESILKRQLMTDNLPCHFASALTSGFITTVVASPVDVVKTRYMNSRKGDYRNPLQCAAQMFHSEGVRAFYKGFIPSYLRLGSWNIVMFISFEQYKRIFKNGSF